MPRAREREPRGDRRVPSRPVALEKEKKKALLSSVPAHVLLGMRTRYRCILQ